MRRRSPRLGDSLKASSVFALHADEDPQRRTRITFVTLDILRLDGRKYRVEVAGLRIFGCPRGSTHTCLSRRLRSISVELQPVTISQVVGSMVCSITSVRILPPSVLPIISRRVPASSLCGLRTVTLLVARELAGLVGGDGASPELPNRRLRRQELVDDVGHRRAR
jgi:hypothetical protein